MFNFSLIDELIDILRAAINFFCDKMIWFFDFITSDITTYNGGAVWDTVSLIYDALLSIGIPLGVVFMYINVLESSFRFIEMKKASVWITLLFSIVLLNGLFYIGKELLLWVFRLINNISIYLINTLGVESVYMSLPDGIEYIIAAADPLDIVVFLVVVIASLFIIVSTLGIMLTVYGRLFNIYMCIAVAPLAMCTMFSRPTRFVAANYIKNFISVCLEVVVMIIAVYLFSAFFENGFSLDMTNIYITGRDWNPTTYEGKLVMGFIFFNDGIVMSIKEYIVTYAAEICMMFLLLVGALKGADTIIKKIFGI